MNQTPGANVINKFQQSYAGIMHSDWLEIGSYMIRNTQSESFYLT